MPDLETLERLHVPDHPSQRQMDVLKLIAKGYTNKQIGRTLQIQCNTVKNHITALNDILQTTNRVEILLAAHRNGWVNLDAK